VYLPTAKQLVVLGHAMLDSDPFVGPTGRGLVATAQPGAALAGTAPTVITPAISESEQASWTSDRERVDSECVRTSVTPTVWNLTGRYVQAAQPSKASLTNRQRPH